MFNDNIVNYIEFILIPSQDQIKKKTTKTNIFLD